MVIIIGPIEVVSDSQITFIVLYFRLSPNMDDRTHPFTL